MTLILHCGIGGPVRDVRKVNFQDLLGDTKRHRAIIWYRDKTRHIRTRDLGLTPPSLYINIKEIYLSIHRIPSNKNHQILSLFFIGKMCLNGKCCAHFQNSKII